MRPLRQRVERYAAPSVRECRAGIRGFVYRRLKSPQAPSVHLAPRLLGPVKVELLGQARCQQPERGLGRTCVEESASFDEIDGHRAMQAEMLTARLH